MEHPIRHEPGRFALAVGEHEASLHYRRLDGRTVDFESTYVPDELRGRHLGTLLVRHALAWARAEGLRVVPSCWFVRSVALRHPEDAALLVD
jgi:hypothetical protein